MEKKIFLRCTHQKCAIMDFCFLKPSQGGDQGGFSLDFDHVWGGEDLYQIW